MNKSTLREPSWKPWHDNEPIRLGISSCLLGAKVRFDGGHKRDRYLTDVLGEWFRWVPVCPEHDIGLGVPRESSSRHVSRGGNILMPCILNAHR